MNYDRSVCLVTKYRCRFALLYSTASTLHPVQSSIFIREQISVINVLLYQTTWKIKCYKYTAPLRSLLYHRTKGEKTNKIYPVELVRLLAVLSMDEELHIANSIAWNFNESVWLK